MLLPRVCSPRGAGGHSSGCVPRIPLTETGVGRKHQPVCHSYNNKKLISKLPLASLLAVGVVQGWQGGEHCADPGMRAVGPLGVPELSGAVSSAGPGWVWPSGAFPGAHHNPLGLA